MDVAILMGSDSDWETVKGAADILDAFGVSYEVHIRSAHRTPRLVHEYVTGHPEVKVWICAAGGAAHLAGVVAALTTRPVIGIPIPTTSTASLDSILSMVQMPGGVPVAVVAAGKGGATNAGLLAVQMLALSNEGLAAKLSEHKKKMEREVVEKDHRLQDQIKKK